MNTMNLFQWIALTFLSALLVVELYLAFRGRVERRLWLLRVTTWIATALAIARPDQLTRLAMTVGITTGANLVSYLGVLLFFFVSLYLYARCLRLERQITQIVRHLAIQEAHAPTSELPNTQIDR